MKNKIRKCENCINFKTEKEDDFGLCKRFPPTPIIQTKWFKKRVTSIYPIVNKNDGGCGELRYKK